MGGHNWEELPSIGNQPYEVRMVGVSSHDASARERGNPVKPGFETFNERLKQLELGYNVEPGTVINQQGGPYFPGQANVISAVGIQQVMVRNASTSALSSAMSTRKGMLGSHPAFAALRPPPAARGSQHSTTVPVSIALWIRIVPPASSTRSRIAARPK